MIGDRPLRALESVLPSSTRIRVLTQQDRDLLVEVSGQQLRLRWMPVGWPRQVTEALGRRPRPDVIAAPQLSPGARELARQRKVGWLDETGAAEIDTGNLIVSRTGHPTKPLGTTLGWRRATLAVCEVLLTGCAATVSAVSDRTGLAVSTVSESLKFLTSEGFLSTDAARGPQSGRYVTDPDELLDAYAAAAERLRVPTSLSVGVLWRDPIAGVHDAGLAWREADITWAITSALAAALISPFLTEVTPWEVYLRARGYGDLRRAATVAGLREIEGGRLLLRPFPTPADGTITARAGHDLTSVLWPRAYADLRTTGVRGEDAAEHLRTEMINASR